MMRAFFPLRGLAACLILSVIALTDAAGQLSAQGPQPRQNLPNVRNAPIAFKRPLDPAVAKILWNWHFANFNIDRFDANFSYVQYDGSLEVETIGQGLASVDREGRAIYKFAPTKVSPGQMGRRYPLQSAESKSWYYTGDRIILVHEADKTYEELILPPEYRKVANRRNHPNRPPPPAMPEDNQSEGAEAIAQADQPPAPAMPEDVSPPNWAQLLVRRLRIVPWTHPLAYAFIMEAEPASLTDQFQISLVRQSATDATLSFVPRRPQEQPFLREVQVMLSLKDYRLRAIKFVGHGSIETVYVLSNVRINCAAFAAVR